MYVQSMFAFMLLILHQIQCRKLRIQHHSIYPILPDFLIYCTENDYAWNYFSDDLFQIFDEDGDEEISPSEWIATIYGITGSFTIADSSLVVYYGIVAGTLEWRMEITLEDWVDFMTLVRDYFQDDIDYHNNGNCILIVQALVNGTKENNSTTNTSNSSNLYMKLSTKGFFKQLYDRDPDMLLCRHQSLGDFLCNNTRNWKIVCSLLFEVFDVDQDGFIEKQEFLDVSKESGFTFDLGQYWTYIDSNMDGKLDRKEWDNAMSYAKVYIEPQLNNFIPNMSFGQLMRDIF